MVGEGNAEMGRAEKSVCERVELIICRPVDREPSRFVS